MVQYDLTKENKSRILKLLRKREEDIAALSDAKKEELLKKLLSNSPCFEEQLTAENLGKSDQTIQH